MDPEPSLDKVLDLLVDTVCVVDAEGRYVYVSASCEQLLGYVPDELIGQNMIDLVHPADRERTLAAAAEIMSGRPQSHFENRYVRKDGRVVDVMWSARWHRPDGLRLAVARDVTPLKRAARLQSAVYAISEAAHQADDLPGLCGIVHRIIGELLPVERFQVVLYDTLSDTLSFTYDSGSETLARDAVPLEVGSDLAAVLRSGDSVATPVDASDASAVASGAWLGVPLLSNDGVVGALIAQTGAGGPCYGVEHRELLQFVSSQVAIAIERKQTEARFRYLALHDPLTGLPNRSLFHDRFVVALRRAERDGERLMLLYVDLDDFKLVNDRFGHETGDRLLVAVARGLEGCVRGSDTVARLGGDEFALLLVNVQPGEPGDGIIDRVRAAVAAPLEVEGGFVTIAASIGSAVYPVDGEDQDALLRSADASMYAGKPDVP
jgi:diguanylate cyclase (GGDEF)-like protein/PAS domain S-box-containing protein